MDNLIEKDCKLTVYGPCSYNSNYMGDEKYLIQAKCFNKLDRLVFHYKYKKVYNKLLQDINVTEYDLLHAHSLFANGYITYKIFQEYHIPYIVAVRNTDINTFFKYFIYLRKLGVKILENASKVILISQAYQDKLLKYIPEDKRENIQNKCTVIPNGIDSYFLENSKTPKKWDNKNLNLVFTGRIDKNKNLITTIKCCQKILKNKYNVKLTVIGPISCKKYKKILKKYDFINYVGPKNKEEIIDIYKDMDIFIMPSKHETFGLVYVEAMTQGLPVIYTKNEGFDQFYKDGEVGYPIKYNDYKEMAEKIDLILQNYEKISQNCIKNSQFFNWGDVALKYIKIYRETLKI